MGSRPPSTATAGSSYIPGVKKATTGTTSGANLGFMALPQPAKKKFQF